MLPTDAPPETTYGLATPFETWIFVTCQRPQVDATIERQEATRAIIGIAHGTSP